MRIVDDVGYYYYKGQPIITVKQGDGESVSLFSAKDASGKVTGNSVQLIQNITDDKYDIRAKINCNYFVMSDGMALGVRCGVEEWSVPRQGAWYYYAILKNGKTEIGMDYDFWYTPAECVFACSPAMILMKDGQHVNYTSPAAKGTKDVVSKQSLFIRAGNRFAMVASAGSLTVKELKNWCMMIEGIQDIIVLDGGGSVCLEDKGRVLVPTTREISNCIGFYEPKTAEKTNGGQNTMPKTETAKKFLNGIDISNWQRDIDLSKINFDFVIAKATEGVSYVDPYCDGFIQQAKKLGKLWGFYHFARPTNDAVKEAKYFVSNTRNYFGHGIPVLDWEAEYKNNTDWALTWLNVVYTETGVKPLIYMSESVVNAYDWSKVVAGDYGLWVAKYRDNIADYNYDMTNAGATPKVKWWKGYAMWQWTSSGILSGYSGSLDCDIFYGDEIAWLAYAKAKADDQPIDTIDSLKAEIASLRAENTDFGETIKMLRKRIEAAEKALRGE